MKTKWKVYWAIVISTGTVLLSTARTKKSESIKAYLNEVGGKKDWKWVRRNEGLACQRVAIAVRNAA